MQVNTMNSNIRTSAVNCPRKESIATQDEN